MHQIRHAHSPMSGGRFAAFGRPTILVLSGVLALALASRIEVPMLPVPMNLQSLAVPVLGMVYGWRLGAYTVAAWLLGAAIGLPVLSGGAAGLHHFFGPTAGYLFAFPLAAGLAGWLGSRGWSASLPSTFAAMLLANLTTLLFGSIWLASLTGLSEAIAVGLLPFLLGDLLKSAFGACLVRGRAHLPFS